MMLARTLFTVFLVFACVPACAQGQEHPLLLLSADDVPLMRASQPLPGLFEEAVATARARTAPWLEQLPEIPLPRDAGGGYTHEQHKRNSVLIQNAGALYQLTGDAAYADLARRMLEAYAELYPALGEHPQKKEQTPGRLFWQSLNEAVWLVTSIQGYDAIYTHLTSGQRDKIETGLLRPMATFLSAGQPGTFDRVHNHGTWAVAAVGMTGFVLGDADYVEIALHGLNKDGSAGFMTQLDHLFSPDGYYSEGPYYQRYALMPFLLFAKSIERNRPKLRIFEYRDGILLKAVHTTIRLSYNGLFFPINDAIKDKGIDTIELVYGVAIAFGMTEDAGLLSIAQRQGRTVLTGDGFRLARALEHGGAQPYPHRSVRLLDGPDGDQGALDILRSGTDREGQAVVFKATAQGMGHGHFDRLAWLLYDNGREIVPDYGAARFLNVESKNGGHYLPENTSWAKQTVAHNTLVVDEQSHYGGNWKRSQEHATLPLYFETGQRADIAAARIDTAYQGVSFSRVLVHLKDAPLPMPLVLDVLSVDANGKHQFDLPLHFRGQVTDISHELVANTTALQPLGKDHGYQHLWHRASAKAGAGELFQLTFLNGNRFYTHSALTTAPAEFLFAETGANDPNFNLRHEQVLIQRVRDAAAQVFVSVMEPHGEYNGSREYTTESASGVAAIEHAKKGSLQAIRIKTKGGAVAIVALSFDPDPEASHQIELAGRTYEWTGFFQIFDE